MVATIDRREYSSRITEDHERNVGRLLMLEKFRFRQIPRRYSHCLYLDDASRYIQFFVTL